MMRLLKTNMNRAAIIILLLAGAALAQGAPSLTVGDVTYENVTLKKEYPRSFFIQHDGGTAFIERSKLSEEQIAELLKPSDKSEPAAAEVPAKSEATTEKAEVEYVHPSPDSLSSEEERKFFEACGKADTATIVAMLKENPSLAKVIIKGQSQRQILPQMIGEEWTPFREEPAETSCDPLQWLIDESEKSPGRIEAIKALVEAGADPKRSTSEVGLRINMTRGPVSIPDKLTPEELDYLLSKGADPTVGFCVGNILPMVKLALGFVSEQDASKKAEHGEMLRAFIKNGADPAAEGGGEGTEKYGGKLAEARSVKSAAQVRDITQDPELIAILAGQ